MSSTTAEKRAAFRQLHESGCFVMPNPWDVGSAILLQEIGFQAVASTSSGFAWTMGRPDYGLKRDEVLRHLSMLAEAIDIPLNADFENAFADDPRDVERNVAMAVDTGVSGLSVEDSTPGADAPLYPVSLAAERIAAARAAIDAKGGDVVLTGRAEGFLWGRKDLGETIDRLRAYAEAGADCLYAPGLPGEAEIAEVVKAVAPKPVNVLPAGLPVATLAGLGVRRISTGGALARTGWAAVAAAAKQIAEEGRFDAFAQAASGDMLDSLFDKRGNG